MIRFACPTCHAVMEAPAHKVGKKINCLKCGQRLQIPPPPRGTILAKPLPSPEGPSAKSSSARGSKPGHHRSHAVGLPSVSRTVELVCPTCNSKFQAEEATLGLWVKCPRCDEGFIASTEEFEASLSGQFSSAPPADPGTWGLPGDGHYTLGGSSPRLFRQIGLALVCLGICLVLFFAVIYDASIAVYPWAGSERVYNLGRMQNRWIGVVVGFGILAGGAGLTLYGRKMS